MHKTSGPRSVSDCSCSHGLCPGPVLFHPGNESGELLPLPDVSTRNSLVFMVKGNRTVIISLSSNDDDSHWGYDRAVSIYYNEL